MDHAVPAAAAPAPSLVPALTPIGRPGLSSISFLFTSRQEGDENRRHVWRPWLSSTSDSVRQVRTFVNLAICGATGAEFTKANSEFHHPVRLFWPKSRSFDYLYRDGEILLRNFPVQATINLYEDSDSEEEEEVEEEEDEKEKVEKDQEEEKKDTDGKGPQGDVRVQQSTPHRAPAYPPSPPLPCPN
ncbi:protein ripply1 [Sorex fumeus]|uniref:protein ripply1 n=1 Tax=Sorex fumeus TaxID=62283 RepID=UPI0024AE0587|nr:protein ripply1 [Sorex fumeus]